MSRRSPEPEAPLVRLCAVLPGLELQRDVCFGWPLLTALSTMKVGSAISVRERDVIAVCAAESIETMIDRTRRFCPKRGWSLLAASGAEELISPPLLERIAALGGRCLAVGGALTPAVIDAADHARVSVVRYTSPLRTLPDVDLPPDADSSSGWRPPERTLHGRVDGPGRRAEE